MILILNHRNSQFKIPVFTLDQIQEILLDFPLEILYSTEN